jgi:hypothetical protein
MARPLRIEYAGAFYHVLHNQAKSPRMAAAGLYSGIFRRGYKEGIGIEEIEKAVDRVFGAAPKFSRQVKLYSMFFLNGIEIIRIDENL